MTREEKERIQQKLHRAADAHLNAYGGNLYYEGVARGLEQAAGIVGKTKCVDAVEVVRCKDCKHRPHIEKAIMRYRQEIEVCAPMVDGREDYSCMCLNPDNSYFSWMPDDDWFCADGERRESDG